MASPFNIDNYLAARQAADTKLAELQAASQEKIKTLQAYNDALIANPPVPDNSWSTQAGLPASSVAGGVVNLAASAVSGASRIAGQLAQIPVAAYGAATNSEITQSDISAYNRKQQGIATPEDEAYLNHRATSQSSTALERIQSSNENRNIQGKVADFFDLTGTVNQFNRNQLNEDLGSGFQANWDKAKEGDIAGIAGLIVNAGSALFSNPQAVTEYVVENAPQLAMGSAGPVGAGLLAASNVGYAVDLHRKGMEEYAKKNGGQLPSVDRQREMAMQSVIAAVAEYGSDLAGVGIAKAGFKPVIDGTKEAARAGFKNSLKNIGKAGMQGAVTEGPTEGFQTYMEGLINDKPATAEELYSSGIIGAAAGHGLQSGVRTLAEASKTTPEFAAIAKLKAEEKAKFEEAIASGDVSAMANPASPSYAPDKAVAALFGHSQQEGVSEADKQANLERATKIVEDLRTIRDTTAKAFDSKDEIKAQIDETKAKINELEEGNPLIAAYGKRLEALNTRLNAPEDQKVVKANQTKLKKEERMLAEAEKNLTELRALVLNKDKVDAQINDLTQPADPEVRQTQQDAINKTITLSMRSLDVLTSEQATKLAEDTNNGLTDSQRTYLRALATARQEANALSTLSKVNKDVLEGTDKNLGILSSAKRISAALDRGDIRDANYYLGLLEKFAQHHRAKSNALNEAAQQGYGTQIHSTNDGGWVVAKPNSLPEKALRENGGLAFKSDVMRHTIQKEADALEAHAAAMRAAVAMVSKPDAAEQPSEKVNNVPNQTQQGTNPQPATEAAQVQAAGPVGSASAETPAGSGPVAEAAVNPVDASPHEGARVKSTVSNPVFAKTQVNEGNFVPSGDLNSQSNQDQDTQLVEVAKESTADTTARKAIPTTESQTPKAAEAASTVNTEVATEGTNENVGAEKTQQPVVEEITQEDPETDLSRDSFVAEQLQKPYQERELVDLYLRQVAGKDSDSSTRPLVREENFLDGFSMKKVLSFLKPGYGRDMSIEQQAKVRKLFEHFKETADKWFPHITKNLKLNENRNYFYKNLLQYKMFVGEDGKVDLPANWKTAIVYAGFTHVAMNLNNGVYADKDTVNKILGRSTDNPVSDAEMQLLGNVGVTKEIIIAQMGQTAAQALGLKLRKDAKKNLLSNLETSLGIAAYTMLLEAGILEVTKVPGKYIAAVSGITSFASKPKIYFVRTKLDSSGNPIAAAQNIYEAVSGTNGVLDKLFGSEAGLRGPEFEPIPYQQSRVKRTSSSVPQELVGILEYENSIPNHLREDNWQVMQSMSLDAQMNILGARGTDGQHVSQHGSINARNEAIKRDLEKLFSFVQSMPNKAAAFFFPHMMQKQQRVGIDSNTVNPQSSKYHRHMIYRPDWEVEIDPANKADDDLFLSMVSAGFGVNVDKQTLTASRDDLQTKFLDKVEISSAINMLADILQYESADYKMTPEQEDVLLTAVEIGGENMHSLDALVSLAKREIALRTGSSYKSQFMLEVDGVNNGPIMTLLMLGAADSLEEYQELMQKGGFFDTSSEYNNMTEWRNNRDNLDLYERLADSTVQNMSAIINAMETSLNVGNTLPITWQIDGKAVVAKDNTIIAVDRQADGSVRFTTRNENSGKVSQHHVDRYGNNLTRSSAKYHVAGSDVTLSLDRIEKASKSITFFTGELQDEEGRVTKAARNMVKKPQTALVFGSAVSKLVDHLANSFVDYVNAKLQDVANTSNRTPEEVQHSIAEVQYNINMLLRIGDFDKITLPKDPKQLLQYQLDPEVLANLASVHRATMGVAAKRAIEQNFKEFLSRRQLFTRTANLIYGMYDAAYSYMRDEMVKELVDSGEIATTKEGHPIHDLTQEQENELKRKVREIFPSLGTSMSAGDHKNTGLEMLKTERGLVRDNSAYEQEATYAGKIAGLDGKSVKAEGFAEATSAPGPAMLPMSVHSTESANSHRTANGHQVLNLHDAHGSGIADIVPAAQRLNGQLWDTLLNYSPATAMANSLSEFLQGMATLLTDPRTDDRVRTAIQYAMLEYQEKNHLESETPLQDILKQITQMAYTADKMKLEFMANAKVFDQFAIDGGAVQITEDQREHAKKKLESLSNEADRKATEAAKLVEEQAAKASNRAYLHERLRQQKAQSIAQEDTLVDEVPTQEIPVDTFAWDAVGKPVNKSNPEIIKFLKEKGSTPAVEVMRALWKRLNQAGSKAEFSEFHKALLQRLSKIVPKDLPVQYVTKEFLEQNRDKVTPPDDPSHAWLEIDARTGKPITIYVLSDEFVHSRVSTEALLHEITHAALSSIVQSELSKREANPDYKSEALELIDDLDALRLQLQENMPEVLKNEFAPALKNVHELIAWGMTNNRFMAHLRNTVVTPKTGNLLVKAAQEFISNLVGLVFGKRSRSHMVQSGLTQLIQNVAGLTQAAEQLQGTPADGAMQTNKITLSMAATANGYPVYKLFEALAAGHPDSKRLATVVDTINNKLAGARREMSEHLQASKAMAPVDIWLKALDTGAAPFATSVMNSDFVVSDAEALVMDQVEATVRAALDNPEATTRSAYTALRKLYREAYERLKPQDFYKGADWNTASAAEKAEAQALYDFLFKMDQDSSGRSEHLARFVALTLGHGDVNRLMAFVPEGHMPLSKAQRYRSTPLAADTKISDTLANRVLRWFENVLEFFRSKSLHLRPDQPANDQITSLFEQLVDIEAKHRLSLAQSQYKGTAAKVEGALEKALHAVKETALDVAQSNFVRSNPVTAVRVVGSVGRIVIQDQVGMVMDNLMKLRDRHFQGRLGLAAGLLNDIKGPMVIFESLHTARKMQEKERTAITHSVADTVDKAFSPAHKLSSTVKKDVTAVFLRTGLHSLVDSFSMQQIEGMLRDPAKLKAAVSQLENSLIGSPAMQNYAKQQANYLAYYKATGINRSQMLMLNAHNIARMFQTGIENQVTEAIAAHNEPVIKQLISLYALNYQDTSTKRNALDVLHTELGRTDGQNGVEFILRLHASMEQESLERLFKGNPALMEHGYLPEIYNPNTNLVTAGEAQGKELVNQGYIRVGDVMKDPHDPNRNLDGIYVLRDGGLRPWLSGAIAMNTLYAKGSAFHDGYVNPHSAHGQQNNQKMHNLHVARQRAIQDMMGNSNLPDLNQLKDSFMAPIMNEQGGISNWRYLMQNRTKDIALERDNRFDKVLGTLAGQVFDRQTSHEVNTQVIQATKQVYDAEFARNPESYTALGPNSTDPDARELWQMLPDRVKADIKAVWGREAMMVRKDHMDILFGYRKLSLSEAFDKDADVRNAVEKVFVSVIESTLATYARAKLGYNNKDARDYAKRASLYVRRGEKAWQEIVQETKDIIVVRTGVVLLGNIISNMSLLWLEGVPIKDIAHHHLVAIKAGTAYMQDSKELRELKTYRDSGYTQGRKAEIDRQIIELEDALARNPVRGIIEEGLMPTIVEDVAANDDIYSYKSLLTRKTDRLTSKVNPKVKSLAKTLYMSHDTQAYQAMYRTTQLSDFVARYTLYQHLTTKAEGAKGHKDAIKHVMDSFINYDLPMHRKMQWSDDMGLTMFTKYFLRIQRVLAKVASEHPARFYSLALLSHFMNLGPIVLDSLAHRRIGNNPFQMGALKYPGSIDEIAMVAGPLALIN